MTNIVISRLMCGLGNQLFQYAAACGIAQVSGAKVALDVTEFALGTQERSFALDRYDLGVSFLTNSSFDAQFRTTHFPPQDALGSLGIARELIAPVYRENSYEFEPSLQALSGNAYLYGFWQSWKYFDNAKSEVRRRLTIPPQNSGPLSEMMQAIKASEAVAVHVRRGDYLSDYNKNIFGICEAAYYARAVELIRDRTRDPKFFVFSDDPGWCKANFTEPDMVVASTAGGDARDDLALMAQCRHHIIANSSMSWWGAWLGEKPDSIVVAPMPWFTQSLRAQDLIPDRWIRLDRRNGSSWSVEQSTRNASQVSVVVLARTGTPALMRALDSVRLQSHRNLDIVIALCDPKASEMNSAARKWAAQIAHSQLACAPRPGLGAALNAALSCTQGEWIAFLDDCDVWAPNKIEIQLEAAQFSAAEVVSCRTVPTEGSNGVPTIFPPPGPPSCSLPRLIKAGHFISGISHVLVHRRVIEALGPFDDQWTPDEDNETWRRLWDYKSVMLWQRLVESPIPYLALSKDPATER